MKRVTQPPRRKKKRYTPIITIIAAMVFITIVIVLICVFTIKPNSQELQLRKALPLKLHLINQSRERQFLLQIHHQMHPHPVQLQ
jgi:flagellar basal body-associated protein FliL